MDTILDMIKISVLLGRNLNRKEGSGACMDISLNTPHKGR
ncbi:hypothetical protein SCG7086_AJ_00100 [Chlamydiales bacterium SCGC AG-110-P3]|nr:hypothetical protein SCG7086_AJ_00100 [Chlamydiales bacterium SCGC AG-110-P3]